ncbi:hypothetical protein X975_21541, partial [Stegodyphus mimosarum]
MLYTNQWANGTPKTGNGPKPNKVIVTFSHCPVTSCLIV